MGISFNGYVNDGNSFSVPAEIRKRAMESIMPEYGTQEYNDWFNLEGDQSRFVNPDFDPRLCVNLNNRNARYVLIELGFIQEMAGELGDVMPIEQFIIGVEATLKRLGDNPEPGFKGYTDSAPGKMTIINCGVEDGYLNDRLARLLSLANAAKEYGATHIGWG
jgi:hypothetical protein